jgi:hypothetical protein
MTIVNYASSVVNKLKALLTDHARVIIYDRHVFIVQATGFVMLAEVCRCYKYLTRVEETDRYKHSSLLRHRINYICKMLNSTGGATTLSITTQHNDTQHNNI